MRSASTSSSCARMCISSPFMPPSSPPSGVVSSFHGGTKLIASYIVHPKAHTSALRSYGLPAASSGLMYSGVPTCISATPSTFDSTLDSPKSPSRTSPTPERKTFLGLMSR